MDSGRVMHVHNGWTARLIIDLPARGERRLHRPSSDHRPRHWRREPLAEESDGTHAGPKIELVADPKTT